MNIEVYPKSLQGNLRPVASKSQGHRLIIAAALSDKPTKIKIGSTSKDIEATLNVIDALGATTVETDEDEIVITPFDSPTPTGFLDCGESGSTLRFLFPVAAAVGGREYNFIGKGKLPQRPMEPLVEELRNHGVKIKGEKLPFRIRGKLKGGTFTLPGDISSQFISGLLFALPLLEEDSTIEITTPCESRGYINMTLEALKIFGIKIQETETGYFVPGNQTYISPGELAVEGDWSNAAFWFVAGALGGEITLTGLNQNSLQGDKEILNILTEMGADIEKTEQGITVKKSRLKAVEIDAGEIPDLVPVLAVAAAAAEGTTTIRNAQRLRLKESDRLFAITQTLSQMGADIEETEDGLIIKGGKVLDGGMIQGFNDHRIVMSAAVASVIARGPVIIQGAEAVNKSYPHFFRDLQQLGGMANVLYLR